MISILLLSFPYSCRFLFFLVLFLCSFLGSYSLFLCLLITNTFGQLLPEAIFKSDHWRDQYQDDNSKSQCFPIVKSGVFESEECIVNIHCVPSFFDGPIFPFILMEILKRFSCCCIHLIVFWEHVLLVFKVIGVMEDTNLLKCISSCLSCLLRKTSFVPSKFIQIEFFC